MTEENFGTYADEIGAIYLQAGAAHQPPDGGAAPHGEVVYRFYRGKLI